MSAPNPPPYSSAMDAKSKSLSPGPDAGHPIPLSGTARLLKVRYQQCPARVAHSYECTNSPGLPISNKNIIARTERLGPLTAGFLTGFLGRKEFAGWYVLYSRGFGEGVVLTFSREFHSVGNSDWVLKGVGHDSCTTGCKGCWIDVVITKAVTS